MIEPSSMKTLGKDNSRFINMAKFVEKDVQYRSGMLTLAGVVMLPNGGPHPGVVFIHGSGSSDRRNKWYQGIARYLASHDIAVLLPDKRGCHKSEGNWRTADFHDLAADAIAGIEALSANKEVDKKRVGLIGVSQGGWIAPLAAHMGAVAFVVSLSGATVTPLEQFRYEHRQDLREKGLPMTLSHISFPFALLFLGRRWHRWKDIKNFDPTPLWETLPVSALLVFGEDDQNVPVSDSLQRLETSIKRTGRQDFLVKVFRDSGHGLREPKGKDIRQDFVHLLAEWIVTK